MNKTKDLHISQLQFLCTKGIMAFLCFIMCLLPSCQPAKKSDTCCIEISFNKSSYCLYFQDPGITYPVYRLYYSQTYIETPNTDSLIFKIILQEGGIYNLIIYVQDSCQSQLDKENMNDAFIERIMEKDEFSREGATMEVHYLDDNRPVWTYTKPDSFMAGKTYSYYHYIYPLDSCRRLFISMKEKYGFSYSVDLIRYDTIFYNMIKSLEIESGKCRHCETGCYKTFHPNFK